MGAIERASYATKQLLPATKYFMIIVDRHSLNEHSHGILSYFDHRQNYR